MKISGCDRINAFFASFSGPPCRAWAVTALAAGFLLFWLPGLCMADAPALASQKKQAQPQHQAHPQQQHLLQYQEQVAFITEQILQTRKDLDWLTLKVKRMQDFDRFVPRRMHDSIAFKQSKITSLEKLKNRYQELIPEPLEKTPPPGRDTRTAFRQQMGETSENQDHLITDSASSPDDMFRQNLEKQMAATGLDSWLEVAPHTTPVRMETRLPILFASASADIPKGYDPFLKNLANLIKGHDVRIVVDGYADTDPINTRQYPSNFELGAARAAAVVRALVENGIKPGVFKIGSTGQYRFDARKTTEWKHLQRHVTIAVFFRSTT